MKRAGPPSSGPADQAAPSAAERGWPPGSMGGRRVLAHQQRQRRAGVRGPAGVGQQVRRYGSGVDDRIAPLVERDPLGEQLGAQPARRRSGSSRRPGARSPPLPAVRGRQARPALGGRAGSVPVVEIDLRSERRQRAGHEPGGAVGEVAGAPTGHDPQPPVEVVPPPGCRPARRRGSRGRRPWPAAR